MMQLLDRLPRELLLHTFSFLTPHDYAQLARVSKSIGALANTSIWTNIDLHVSNRHDYTTRVKVASLFWMLGLMARHNAERAKQVVSRVRSMRVIMDSMSRPSWPDMERGTEIEYTWGMFPMFSNLQSLDLNSQWGEYQNGSEWAPHDSTPALPALRSAKLFGYFPPGFVQYILRSAPTLEWLELGVLDEPMDSEQLAELNSDDDVSDFDSSGGEVIAPRPLPLFPDGMEVPVFPRLKHLHLCKPSLCDPEHYGPHGIGEVWYPERAEKASLSDWSRLLAAVQGTVETLILEHRVVAEYIEGDGLSEREFVEQCAAGPADDHFMRKIVPVFKKHEFPRLRDVQMAGIFGSAPASDRRKQLKKLFVGGGAQCKFMYGKWCYFDGSTGITYWAPFSYLPEDGGDEEVEE